jgi:predicted amidophosphoribosyltransferase
VLTAIDDLTRGEYRFLRPGDLCLYMREYTAGQGFSYSETNSLINNFKKSPAVRETGQWYWKQRAIERLAAELAASLEPGWLAAATLVPIPPSKARDDPEYDGRMTDLLRHLAGRRSCDIRELLVQRTSTAAAHAGTSTRSPSRIAALYDIDESLADPPPEAIGLFDDVLTTGAHFKAAQQLLLRRFPGTPIAGIFLARTVRLPSGR